jgi:hypothetical protein
MLNFGETSVSYFSLSRLAFDHRAPKNFVRATVGTIIADKLDCVQVCQMTHHNIDFDLPPRVEKDDGTPRMVGFELEFSGISLDDAAEAVQSALEGKLASESSAERVIQTSSFGEFIIELDWDFLKRKASGTDRGEEGSEWLEPLSQAAALLVPVEVVCPPIPLNNLSMLTPVVRGLREAGAVGTEESLIAAYGVHINTEIPRLDADTLFAYLRAFAILQWWLVDAHAVDPTRKVSPYIDLYPQAYLREVLSKSTSTMDEIFDDYLEHNASRNRALDLLPMLAEIDSDRVHEVVDDPKIKARPTFHYRMPNCQIERPDWSLAGPWNTWCVVERLVDREDDLDVLAGEYLAADRPILGVGRSDWVRFVDQWLKDRALV